MQERRKPALVIGNCHFRVCSAIEIPPCVARSFACALESEMQLVRRSKILDYEVPMESLPNLGRLTMTQAQTIRFKKAIENHRWELVREIHSQTRQIVIAESEHDPIDQVQSMHMREESATHLGRRSHILAGVVSPLRR